jgi:hypothetical protein
MIVILIIIIIIIIIIIMETLAKRWSVSETKTRNVVVTLSERQTPRSTSGCKLAVESQVRFWGVTTFNEIAQCPPASWRLHERLCTRGSATVELLGVLAVVPGILVLGGILESFLRESWNSREVQLLN